MLTKRRATTLLNTDTLERMKSGAARKQLSETLVLCLDCSFSMHNPVNLSLHGYKVTKLSVMIDAVKSLIDLSRDCRIGIVGYDLGYKVLISPVPATKSLSSIANSLKVGDWTNIEAGIRASSALLTDISSHKRIILLTDGDQTHGDAIAAAKDCAKNNIVIDCIAFGEDAKLGLLNEIAQITGGIVLTAFSGEELRKSFLRLETGVRGLLPKGA